MFVVLSTFSNYDHIRGSLTLWECTWGMTSSGSVFGLSYFCFWSPLKEARSLFSPHRFQWDQVIALSVRTMTPQRDLDCSLVSLPLSSRLDAHPGGMWFVSRYKTSPLTNYITSTSHKGLARGRRMLLLVQRSFLRCSWKHTLPLLSSRVCTYTCSLMQQCHWCEGTHTHTLAYKCTNTFHLLHSCIHIEAENLLFERVQSHAYALQPALLYMHILPRYTCPLSCKHACMDTDTFTHPEKNLEGEMSKMGLKGPLRV